MKSTFDAPGDLLIAEPAAPTGILIGYGRVSTRQQNLIAQIDALKAARCRRIFTDKLSGKNTERPELFKAFEFTQAGDTFVVPSLDRLGRSLQDLIVLVGDLRSREVGFHSLRERIDTTTPGGRLVFHVFAALSEFIRELIVEGTRDGLAAARARGRIGGRPTVVDAELIRRARALLPDPEQSVKSIAALLGVSAGTLYNHIPDLRQLRGTAPIAAIEIGQAAAATAESSRR